MANLTSKDDALTFASIGLALLMGAMTWMSGIEIQNAHRSRVFIVLMAMLGGCITVLGLVAYRYLPDSEDE